ncbi:MAG: helix-turn-helix domain-containing protein [Chitinophagaceae bacterium]
MVDPIGAQLKEVREKLNLTIPQLAPILKIKAATIYKWEEGKSSPRYKNREILVKWLESVHWKEILNTGTPKTGTSATQETPVSEKGERYLANRTRDPHDYKDKYIAALEARLKDMEFLQRIVDVSLNAIQDRPGSHAQLL